MISRVLSIQLLPLALSTKKHSLCVCWNDNKTQQLFWVLPHTYEPLTKYGVENDKTNDVDRLQQSQSLGDFHLGEKWDACLWRPFWTITKGVCTNTFWQRKVIGMLTYWAWCTLPQERGQSITGIIRFYYVVAELGKRYRCMYAYRKW